ncbi:glycosyltransferase family A protein [Aneurinibacillus sp. Ricciae_BoGa-3]|uniref:glycosyltransferase n=1 Tax=Aneurinibacillus sp. Ricciae_BoGa-3 TaxID=3022697 RepID=UPI0023420249|nr:glycosyltransferase family A protein [Aneurinibacillus sp. Ricciae_BoGa-3]WCK56532.1 glycosyltransferase family A protein [Aneurinibacillus sp. Ricciae_BoGa-3]
MKLHAYSKHKTAGVSVITCTNRAGYIHNLFRNYNRQNWGKKELIIILNKANMEIEKYWKMAKKYKNISVYQLPEKTSLGRCLNYGVKKSKYHYVAKFDDDDYYAPSYLKDSIHVFKKTSADIVGKSAHYLWLVGRKTLILRNPHLENKFVSLLPGATLVIKRNVFHKVKFSNQTIGEDDKFCKDATAKGFKIFSGGRKNFIAVRRKNTKTHTWMISEKKLLSKNNKIISGIKSYREARTISSM